MSEEKEFKHFCDNPNCPNHKLEMNDEKHYHIDKDCVGGICGILKTHRYYHKRVIPNKNTFLSRGFSHIVVEKEFYFCDNCKTAIDFYKENMHE